MSINWSIGDVTITRIVEIESLIFPADMVVAGLTAEEVLSFDWMKPHFCTEQGDLKLSFHAFLVRTPGKTILIDTCFGAGRTLPSPAFSNLGHQFLENLAAVDVQPEDVDVVMCTHMHYDHVGWNTRNENGQWVPTFPNARYLYSAQDYAATKNLAESGDPHAAHFADSILPPVAAGLADFIDPVPGYRLCDEISLIATPGHSPGHFSVLISSKGRQAVITGDVMHNPVQCALPDRQPHADEDKAMAVETRRHFLTQFADSGVLLLGTHFPAPTAGHIHSSGDAWKFLDAAAANTDER
jgi:glyoxylase-like metal-dependent hydrolase (beta-lactamase superfamily II)